MVCALANYLGRRNSYRLTTIDHMTPLYKLEGDLCQRTQNKLIHRIGILV